MHNTAPGPSIIHLSPRSRHVSMFLDPALSCPREGSQSRGLIWAFKHSCQTLPVPRCSEGRALVAGAPPEFGRCWLVWDGCDSGAGLNLTGKAGV